LNRTALTFACLLAGAAAQVPPGKHAAPHKTHVPVVPPHHGPARKPVHPAAKLAEKPKPPPAPAKPKPAKPAIPANEGTVTHFKLPRYACLRSDDVNMRAGPGERYPVLWQYKRRDLPVKIEREFDVWRLVEDMEGIKGWVNQALLTGRRTFVITTPDPVPLRAAAAETETTVAILKPGVVGRILACDTSPWCRVQVADYQGYLPRTAFWGTDPAEPVTP
jgi:SH3-like domain-containing protein